MKDSKYLTARRFGIGPELGLVCLCTAAQADVKDPLPDSLSLGGVTIYGTVDVGYAYQSLSYAFSFLGYSGFNGGAGSTEGARWDNSVKYAYGNGPLRVAAMYSNGGQDTGLLGKSFGADAGTTFGDFSADFVYLNEKGAVNLRSSFDDGANPIPTPGLAAFISNDRSYNLMGKYTFAFGDSTKPDKLTVYAGYSHIEKAHSSYAMGESQGNFPLAIGITIDNPTIYDMEWMGGRYVFSSGLNLTGAVYYIKQNNWSIGLGPTGTENLGCAAAGLLCSGNFKEASFVADYVINKHYDVYIGANYSEVMDGLANGFVGTTVGTAGSETQITGMFGLRIKF